MDINADEWAALGRKSAAAAMEKIIEDTFLFAEFEATMYDMFERSENPADIEAVSWWQRFEKAVKQVRSEK